MSYFAKRNTYLGVRMFYKAIKVLKKASICNMPIKVRRTSLKGLDGCCEKKDDHFLVKINKNLPENHAIDVLIHEIAHADAWDKAGTDIHGDIWGVCYSRLYRIWEKYL